MLDSDEEDEGDGTTGDTAVGRDPPGATPTLDDEDLSNDAENFSHVSHSTVQLQLMYRISNFLFAFRYLETVMRRRVESHKAVVLRNSLTWMS